MTIKYLIVLIVKFVNKKAVCAEFIFTRRGSEIWITDLAETLGYVFGYRSMKRGAILDPDAQKN